MRRGRGGLFFCEKHMKQLVPSLESVTRRLWMNSNVILNLLLEKRLSLSIHLLSAKKRLEPLFTVAARKSSGAGP